MFLHKPDLASFIKFATLSFFSGVTTYILANPRGKRLLSEKNLIVTTGCDSGLGYSIAVHCHEKLKASIVACVHQKHSRGAEKLKAKFGNSKRFHMCELDVTQNSSINELRRFVEELLETKEELGNFAANFKFSSF
jgi:NAD(P)-dependent dehydrogenase (short-subunit alcohol dehydrogenase family)